MASPWDQASVAERDGIWSGGGVPVEEFPDPFATEVPPGGEALEPEPSKKRRRRRWPIYLYIGSGLILVTLLWLVITAPLSRALEPLADPAMLLVSDDGHAIARRGAVKEAPVDVTRLNRLTPAAFVAIEDRRFYRHWGIDPRGIARAEARSRSRSPRPISSPETGRSSARRRR